MLSDIEIDRMIYEIYSSWFTNINIIKSLISDKNDSDINLERKEALDKARNIIKSFLNDTKNIHSKAETISTENIISPCAHCGNNNIEVDYGSINTYELERKYFELLGMHEVTCKECGMNTGWHEDSLDRWNRIYKDTLDISEMHALGNSYYSTYDDRVKTIAIEAILDEFQSLCNRIEKLESLNFSNEAKEIAE